MEKFGPYKIIKKLEVDTHGEIFLIEKESKYYRIKKIKINEPFNSESNYIKLLNLLKTIKNENIIRYYDYFLEKDYLNIIMEYAGNLNLKKFIWDQKNKNKFIEEKVIKNIIEQICLGLKEIHNNNIIHRDLSPDNISIGDNFKIKIGGFDAAKIVNTEEKYSENIYGKNFYKAPEIEKGEKYNNKVDIYTLGCIIYELFTLNEYYKDKIIEGKDGKINFNMYNKNWQELIELLLQTDYNKRPNTDEIIIKVRNIDKNIVKKTINILFEYNGENKSLSCELDMKVEEMINKFLIKIGKEKYIGKDINEFFFFYNGIIINKEKFRNQSIKELNIRSFEKIFVREIGLVTG